MINWRNYFTSTILERGRSYWKENLISEIEYINGKYEAIVFGSDAYLVEIWKKQNDMLGMRCTCPYAEDGHHCKHMAAVCMKLGDKLNSKVISVDNVKADKKNQRVYPFDAKIDDDKYVYYDLSELTSNIEITRGELDVAQQLIESGNIVLDKVEIGYRQRENEFYRKEMIHGGRVVGRHINKNVERDIEIHFDMEGIVIANCQVIKCNNYYTGKSYYYGSDKLCVHQLALLLLFGEYIEKYNPGDTTAFEARRLMNIYNGIGKTNAVSKYSKIQEDVRLEPKLEWSFGTLKLSFRVGTSKLFVVKNLSDFVTAVEEREKQKYGSKTEIDYNVHKMDSDSAMLYEYLRKIVKEESLRMENTNYDEKENEIASGIKLFGNRMDKFFDICMEQNREVVLDDKEENDKGKIISFSENSEKLQLTIRSENNQKNMFKGIVVEGLLPKIIYGEDSLYWLLENKLVRIDRKTSDILYPLVHSIYGRYVHFEIGRKALSDFYNQTYQILSEAVDFVEEDKEIIEKYLPPKAEYEFYLDWANNRNAINCEVKVTYGDKTYNLLNVLYKNPNIESIRDKNSEDQVLFHMDRYFEERDIDNELFVSSDDEEQVFDILENGIGELMGVGNVYCTESLKKINVKKKVALKVGVSLESGLMDLTISSDDLTNQELLEILASYKKKKKYHRLKNGDFINIEDDNLEMINSMVEGLHISSKEFLKGNIKIPAYRALYLDKILEKKESVYIERDKHFKALIKEFKVVEDSDFEVPKNLQKVLRGYQTVGYRWLRTLEKYGFGGILADDMGLGKTLQVITLLKAMKDEDNGGTSIIVAPASLIYNWQDEFKRFAPDVNTLVIAGAQKDRIEQIKTYTDYDVLITSYDLLKRDIAEYEDTKFEFQIIDEAQYIKNHNTAVAKSVKCINSRIKYALTGTPIENRLSELWSIFDYLMPGFLYGYETFRKELETPIAKSKDEGASIRLRKLVSPFILRRLKQDVLKDLPEKIEETLYACFDEKQQKLYDGQVIHMKEMLAKQSNEEFEQNKIQVLAELTKLRQICCDPSLLFENYKGESAKSDACIDLIKSAIEGEHRILVFSQFTSMLALLEERFKEEGIEYYKITGATSKEERVRLVKSFNEGNTPVFLISLKAGGTGLNLVGADIVVHYDPWWNQAVQNQATDRAHRIGQKKIVTVYKLIAKRTIEEKIMILQEMKKNLADEILSGGNNGLMKMTKEELMDILC